jgi:hypothetical protein
MHLQAKQSKSRVLAASSCFVDSSRGALNSCHRTFTPLFNFNESGSAWPNKNHAGGEVDWPILLLAKRRISDWVLPPFNPILSTTLFFTLAYPCIARSMPQSIIVLPYDHSQAMRLVAASVLVSRVPHSRLVVFIRQSLQP